MAGKYFSRPECEIVERMAQEPSAVTLLLRQWGEGNESAAGQLMPLVYAELHRMARRHMALQNPGHTLQPTALINEAYLRMASDAGKDWQSRAHFFAVAATAMRHILVDWARARTSAKRGGGQHVVALEDGLTSLMEPAVELIALDDALRELEALHPRQARVNELRFFGGESVEETASILQVSPETVMRDWRAAKAWLSIQLGAGGSDAAGRRGNAKEHGG
jgi:RNA polymerase sigma-70 factor (ECF subfamily)